MTPRSAAAALALLTTACAAPMTRPDTAAPPPAAAPVDPVQAWDARRNSLSTLADFSAQGRVAASGKGSANLLWEQSGDNFRLKLNGPFGVGTVRIAGTVDHVSVEDADGRSDTNDPEGALADLLGWRLPVRSLRWWALGVPSPQPIHGLTVDAQGRALLLVQDGWTIRYEDYEPVAALELPRRYTLENDDAKVRVVVDRWVAPAPPWLPDPEPAGAAVTPAAASAPQAEPAPEPQEPEPVEEAPPDTGYDPSMPRTHPLVP